MVNYQHILIGVDFSSETARVLDRGLELADTLGSKVSFIHVVEYTGYLLSLDTPFPMEMNLELQFVEKAAEQLTLLASSRGRSEATRFVEVGSSTHEIVRVAEEHQVDLVVLGSHGRHGFQRILGSTASGVLHTSKCDVLAVRIRAASS